MIVNLVCIYLEDLIKVYKIQKINSPDSFSQNYDFKKSKSSHQSVCWYNLGEEIDLYQFCQRILQLTSLPEINIIYTLILISRFLKNTYLELNNNIIIRLILIGSLISSKILDDDFYNNKFWSFLGGIDIFTLNKLEVELLLCCEGYLNVSSEELIETYRHIIGYLKYHNLIDNKLQITFNKNFNSNYLFQER